MVFVACRNSTCFQKLNIIVYFLTFSYSISFLKMCDNILKIWEVEIFIFGDVSGPMAAKWPKVNCGLKIVNYFTCVWHFSCRWYRPPEVDLNGYPRISNPYCCNIQIRRCEWTQDKKITKVNRQLKIVNYFTCMLHFSCRWYRPPEVDLNWYPRICNPYCRDI